MIALQRRATKIQRAFMAYLCYLYSIRIRCTADRSGYQTTFYCF